MSEAELLQRITVAPHVLDGKPSVSSGRLTVEEVLGMLAGGDTPQIILLDHPWLEPEDIYACLAYAQRVVAHEHPEPAELLAGEGAN